MAPPVEQGLCQVYPPEGATDETQLDIVAIHGLGTSSPLTWLANVYGERQTVERQVNWLSDPDMLPAAIPSARVYTFNWNSNYYENAPIIRIVDVSEVLLERLKLERDKKDSHSRPLIFVASCFGGVILAQALDLANRRGSEHVKVLTATCGIVFLGSPLQGTRAAKAAEWRNMLAGILGRHPSDTLLQDLDGSTRKLYEVTRRFVEAVSSGQMETRIVCFHETQTTQVLNAVLPRTVARWMPYTKLLLVDEDSATLVGYKKICLDVRHAMMNKYRGAKDPNYELVVGAIKEMAQVSHRVVSTQRKEPSRKSRFEVIPFAPVGSYTNRSKLSTELEEKLHTYHDGHDPPHALAVYGLGGCGKTQLTLDYIKNHREKYDAVFWIDVSNEASALNSFKRISEEIGLPTPMEMMQAEIQNTEIVSAVLRWLRNSTFLKWLVVVDNADLVNPSSKSSGDSAEPVSSCDDNSDAQLWVRKIIPRGKNGSVIITSRIYESKRLFDQESDAMEVYKMEPKEALTLLLKGRKALGPLPQEEQTAAEKIVEILDGLPLAIDLARPVVENSRHPEEALRRYLERIEAHPRDRSWLQPKLQGLSQYSKTVETVWTVSIKAVRSRNAMAMELLIFLSFFDSEAIQDEIFRFASSGLNTGTPERTVPDWLRSLLRYDDGWCGRMYEEAIELLQLFSMLRPLTGEWAGVTMHKLVQWRAKLEIENHQMKDWATWILSFASAASLAFVAEGRAEFRRHLVVHLKAILKEMETLLFSLSDGDNDILLELMVLGEVFDDEGWLTTAESLKIEVMEKMEVKFGVDHRNTLRSMHSVALTYINQGRWQDAENLEVEIVEKMTKKFGIDDPDTLTSMNNLALIYSKQGRQNDAEILELEVMEKMKIKLGVDHPATLTSMNNLALIYWTQSRLDDAATISIEVIEKSRLKLGVDHPATLTSMNILASIYWAQGRLDDAETLLLEVVEKRKVKLEVNHPDILDSTSNLALIYWTQGRLDNAEALSIEVIEKSKLKLGVDHPATLTSMYNLAFILKSRHRDAEAIRLMDETAQRRSALLGRDHKDTISSFKFLRKWTETGSADNE